MTFPQAFLTLCGYYPSRSYRANSYVASRSGRGPLYRCAEICAAVRQLGHGPSATKRPPRNAAPVLPSSTVELFVLRHAIAEDAARGQPDAERALTDEGRRKLDQILARAREAGVKPDVILTSHYLRARQTAEAAAAGLGGSSPVAASSNLLPFSSVFDLWEELREHQSTAQAMVVGHNPQLSEFLALLLGAQPERTPLKKAALACVQIDAMGPQPGGRLVWLLTAKSAGA